MHHPPRRTVLFPRLFQTPAPALAPALVLAMALAVALSLSACARKTQGKDAWDLSPRAQATYYFLLLEEARRQDNATLGEAALVKLLEHDDSPEMFIEAANFFWQAGDAAKTRLLIEEGRKRHPRHGRLQLLLSQLYVTEGRYAEAKTILEAYLKTAPEDETARVELANLLLQAEQFDQALALLEALPQDAKDKDVRYLRAKALTGLARHQEALALLEAIVQEDDQFLEAWADMAYIHEFTKDYKGAEKVYLRIMKLGEPSRELVLRLIEVNIKLGKPDRALSFLEKGPQDLAFFMPVAAFLLDGKHYDLAEKFLASILKKHPGFHELWFHKAMLFYDGRKDIPKALAALDNIPKENRFHERALRFRIHLLFEAGRKQESLDLAARSRDLYPDVNEFWLLHARLLEESDRAAEALDILKQAKTRWPDDPEVLFTLGLVLDKADRKDEAFAVMEEIIQQDPDNADALNYVGYTLAERGKDLERALQLVAKALSLKPDNDFIMDSVAWTQFKLGRKEDAWKSITQAVVDEKGAEVDDPTIWEHYGDIAKALGKLDEARKGYENALKHKHKTPDAIRKKLEAL